jgi:hypothetical protein
MMMMMMTMMMMIMMVNIGAHNRVAWFREVLI